MGDFILPKEKTIPLVFVAGGIGITPFRSIAQWLLDKDESRNITLLYGAQNGDDLLFIDTLQSAGIQVTAYVSKPSQRWTGKTGQLTGAVVYNAVTDPKTHIYLSGPEPMVETLTHSVISLGMPKHQVITDYFPGYTG
jgi:ferredoxin-NADP reductase